MFSISATPSNPLCNGVCDGSIVADIAGGAGPFTYQWLDSGGNPIAGETNPIILNLCAGTYHAQVTASAGCTLTSPAIALVDPQAISATIAATDIICEGQCAGAASVAASGGATGYAYQWYNAANIPITGETYSVISNLCEGTYFAGVTDSNGCSSTHQADISVLITITTGISAEDISCHDADDGSIDLTVNGGTAPLIFSWNNGAYATEDLSNLSEGIYTVIITDSNGCSAADSTGIANPDSLAAFASAHIYPNGFHVTCTDGTNGRATVTVSGGTPPFTYVWSDGQLTPTAIGLALGTYAVTIIDAQGCMASSGVTLHLNPPPLLTTLIADTFFGGWNVSCFGASDGFIDLTVTNGTPPFVYEWLPDHIVFIEDLDSVSAQTYTVYVTDTVNGCSTIDSITLMQPPALSATLLPADVSCLGGYDGAVSAAVTGGTPVYDFSWNNGAFTTQNIVGLTAGAYAVRITDRNGCVILDSVTLVEPSVIPVGNVSVSTCLDSFFAGGAYQTLSGLYYDTIPYGAGCDSAVITDLEFVSDYFVADSVRICEGKSYYVGGGSQTQAGIYYDTLIAAGNCDSVIQTTLLLLPNPLTAVDTTICGNEYYFAGGANQNASGTYYDTLAAFNGCDSIVETTLGVVNVEITAVPDSATVLQGNSVNVIIIGSAGNFTYSWSPAEGLSCNNDCSNVTIVPAGDVSYTVIAADGRGCADTVNVFVEIRDTLNPNSEVAFFYAPNAFSPNGDGINDEFMVTLSNYGFFRLLIFDRWGEKLFETNDPFDGWNGTFKGKLLNPGVYVYYVDVSFDIEETPDDYKKYRKGSVTLLR